MSNRKRRGRPVSGWLILDKPTGAMSTKAVAEIKRLFNAQKAGHAGTLDPLASGCLPIALGEATKTMPQMLEATKTYRFTIAWGTQTDTDDAEGEPVATSEERPERSAISAAIESFVGEIEQIPPNYSAIKIDGQRAYDRARGGEKLDLESRPITIDRFELLSIPDRDHASFTIDCGKGTYVRSLARDLGRKIGTLGHVSELRRLRVGPFDQDSMVTLDQLRDSASEQESDACDRYLQPVDAALDGLAAISVQSPDDNRILRGQPVLIRGADAPVPGPAYAKRGDRLLAVGVVAEGAFHPRRVFHL